jgi:succinate dehydrogenase flavin-adding protein (antitoxin of CptAB toxin-antitoxin module)
MPESSALLRKKLTYQLTYRGTKELDRVMGRVLGEVLPNLPDDLLPHLAVFLQRSEPELTAMVFGDLSLPQDLPLPLKSAIETLFLTKK